MHYVAIEETCQTFTLFYLHILYMHMRLSDVEKIIRKLVIVLEFADS